MGQGQNRIASSLLDIQPTAVLEFYRIYPDTLNKPNVFVPIHNGSVSENNIIWQGIEYLPMPIEGEGFEINGNGRFSRPKLRVSNKDYLISNFLQNNHDFKNAKIIRIRTFLQYLDDENFEGGNPFQSPDSTAEISNDTYLVSQKIAENKMFVELELTSPLDLENFEVNNRLITAKYCYWQYRGHGCNYVGGPIEKEDGYGFATTDGFGYIIEYTATNTFEIVRGSFTWKEAKLDAESRGGRLAILNNVDKNNAVPTYSTQALWIGASDEETEGVWKWVDGTSVVYSNWQDGEPNNVGGSENYASRYSNGKWNDININGYASTPVVPQSPVDGFLTNQSYLWSPLKTYNKTEICYLENSKIYINKNPYDINSYSGPLRNWYVCISDDSLNLHPESNPSAWQKDSCSKKISACKKRFNIDKFVNVNNTERTNSYNTFDLKGQAVSLANLNSTSSTWSYASFINSYLNTHVLIGNFNVAGWVKTNKLRPSTMGAGILKLNGYDPINLNVQGSLYNLSHSNTINPSSANVYTSSFCKQDKSVAFKPNTFINGSNLDFVSLNVERPLSSPHNYLRWSEKFDTAGTNGYWGNNNVTITAGVADPIGGTNASTIKITSAGVFSNVGISNFYESSTYGFGAYGKNTSFVKGIDADLGFTNTSYTDLNQTVTFSIYVKKVSGGARFFYIRCSNMWKGASTYFKDHNQFIVYDLDTNTFIPWEPTKSIDISPTTNNAAYGNYYQPFYASSAAGGGFYKLTVTFLNDTSNLRAFNGVSFGVLPGTLANTPVFNKTLRAVTFTKTTNEITMTDSTPHGFRDGDKTSFYSISATNGITIKTVYYYVKVISPTVFKITKDSGLTSIVAITTTTTGTIKSPDINLTATYAANSLSVSIFGAQLSAGRQNPDNSKSHYYKTTSTSYRSPSFNINGKDSVNLEINNKSYYNWIGGINEILNFESNNLCYFGGSPTSTTSITLNAELANWAIWSRSLNSLEKQYLQKNITPSLGVANDFITYPRKYQECTGAYVNITGQNLYAWWNMDQGTATNTLKDYHTGNRHLTLYGNSGFNTMTNNEAIFDTSAARVTDTNLPFGGFPGTDGFAYGSQ